MWHELIQTVLNQFSFFRFSDLIDILLVSYAIYKLLVFIRDTRTMHLIKGLILFVVVMQVSYMLNLHTIHYILSNVLQVGIIAILILFQPEFRRGLEQIGRSSMGKWFNFEETKDTQEKTQIIQEISRSCQSMSKKRIGALIIIERELKLNDIIETGIRLNADVSSELLVNIFIPKTPLHDGAVIVRGNKVISAACFLPLSQNQTLSKELGTRHRAGLGISEESDAVVVIVSEETGNISIAVNGELNVNTGGETLTKNLSKLLETKKEKKEKKDSRNKSGLFQRKEKKK